MKPTKTAVKVCLRLCNVSIQNAFIELTATPKDNNVIYSVSAAELKASEMIKLPVVLTEHPNDWQACVRDALIQRQALELIAQKESDYVRPILLIQAQDKTAKRISLRSNSF